MKYTFSIKTKVLKEITDNSVDSIDKENQGSKVLKIIIFEYFYTLAH